MSPRRVALRPSVFRLAAGLALGLGLASPPAIATAETLSGAYLAARHAAQNTDVAEAASRFDAALARDPDNVALMEQAVIFGAAAGHVEDALPVAERLEEAAPGHRMAALALTAEAIRNGDFAAASARIDAHPDAYHPLVAAMLGAWAAFGAGDEAKADAAFATLDDRPIFTIFTGYHQGLMRHAAGDAEGAVVAYQRAADEMTTPTGRIARAYAAALRATGDNEAARALYDGAAALTVGDAVLEADIASLDAGAAPTPLVSTPAEGAAEALYGLAAALGRDGEEKLSLFYTRIALYLRPGFDDAALLAAELLDDEDQYALAIDAYESIPPESPLSRAAEIGRADALRAKGDEAEAIEALKALARRAPDAVDAHTALGDLYRRSERFAEGAVAYDAAIRILDAQGRPNWVLYYERGICYERSGEWDKAEADFFSALELREDQPLVLNYLGYSWLEKGRNVDRAMEMIEKAVEQRPEDGYIVDSLGWGHYIRAQYDDAVEHLERAVELRPVDPVINDHFGDALWQVGRRLEAAFQWRRALSFGPEPDDAARIKKKLDQGLDAVLAEEAKAEQAGGEPSTASNGG